MGEKNSEWLWSLILALNSFSPLSLVFPLCVFMQIFSRIFFSPPSHHCTWYSEAEGEGSTLQLRPEATDRSLILLNVWSLLGKPALFLALLTPCDSRDSRDSPSYVGIPKNHRRNKDLHKKPTDVQLTGMSRMSIGFCFHRQVCSFLSSEFLNGHMDGDALEGTIH